MLNEMMIRCFLSLCQTRNFTHTASVLFLSQQAVSHNISKMEEELGVQLFRRGSRGAAPTEFALRYQEVFLRLASDLAELHEDVQRGWTSVVRLTARSAFCAARSRTCATVLSAIRPRT